MWKHRKTQVGDILNWSQSKTLWGPCGVILSCYLMLYWYILPNFMHPSQKKTAPPWCNRNELQASRGVTPQARVVFMGAVISKSQKKNLLLKVSPRWYDTALLPATVTSPFSPCAIQLHPHWLHSLVSTYGNISDVLIRIRIWRSNVNTMHSIQCLS